MLLSVLHEDVWQARLVGDVSSGVDDCGRFLKTGTMTRPVPLRQRSERSRMCFGLTTIDLVNMV